MAIYGVDSCNEVTAQVNGASLVSHAYDLFGEYPAFWGRYFNGTSSTTCEYIHATENGLLSEHNIKVLPIARQTGNVGGTKQQGINDATNDVNDLIATFGKSNLQNNVAVFLDAESGTPLSAEYWAGWAETIFGESSVSLYPCLYASQGATATWDAINYSNTNYGMGCGYIWVARYKYTSGCHVISSWDAKYVAPDVTLNTGTIAIWQNTEGCQGANTGFDTDLMNPNVNILSQLITV